MAAPAKGKGEEEEVVGQEEEEEDEERCLEVDELAREMERFDIRERWEEEAEALRQEDAAATEAVGRRVVPAFSGLVMFAASSSNALCGRTTPYPSGASMPPKWPPQRDHREVEVERLILFLANREHMVLYTLFHAPHSDAQPLAEVIIFYAADIMDGSIGQHLLSSILNDCSDMIHEAIITRITQNRDRMISNGVCSLSCCRSVDVVKMIRSCKSRKSCQIVRDAIMPWMAPSRIQSLLNDSDRLKVVQARVDRFPLDIAKFLFDVVGENCTGMAFHPSGLLLLQNCLERMTWKEKDNIFTQLSFRSVRLAQHHNGNYIVQNVLEERNESHLAIIASCFRGHYVDLARQKYSSRVVEKCLAVFDYAEQCIIVSELIFDPDNFRDLVTDDFANYVISKALETCMGFRRSGPMYLDSCSLKAFSLSIIV
ncbi:hypothetical protein ABZP36_035401 [Zizania latifolia]